VRQLPSATNAQQQRSGLNRWEVRRRGVRELGHSPYQGRSSLRNLAASLLTKTKVAKVYSPLVLDIRHVLFREGLAKRNTDQC